MALALGSVDVGLFADIDCNNVNRMVHMDFFEDDLQDMDLDVDVLGKAFENVIDDWKIKMEVST